jgi:hypothetical protein
MLAGQRNGLNHVFNGPGNDNADGYLTIVRSIDGIESASAIVEADFASYGGAEICRENIGLGAGVDGAPIFNPQFRGLQWHAFRL